MTEIYVATVKIGADPVPRFAFIDKEDAESWLEDQLLENPSVDVFAPKEYNKTVYVNGEDKVVGHIEAIPMMGENEQATVERATLQHMAELA